MRLDLSVVLAGIGIVGAFITAIVALRKAKPDAASVLVNASEDVVMIQVGLIGRLKEDIASAHRRIGELQTLEAEVARLRGEVARLAAENHSLKNDNERLRERIKHLEDGT